MARVTCASAANILVQLLTIGCGVGFFLVVLLQLWKDGWQWGSFSTVTANFSGSANSTAAAGSVCLMAKPSVSINTCAFSYAAVGVSWLVAILLLLAQFFKDSCCCSFGEYLLATFGIVWWAGASTALTVLGVNANGAHVPQQSWRALAIFLAWAQLALYCASLLLTCCGGCGGRRKPAPERRPSSASRAAAATSSYNGANGSSGGATLLAKTSGYSSSSGEGSPAKAKTGLFGAWGSARSGEGAAKGVQLV